MQLNHLYKGEQGRRQMCSRRSWKAQRFTRDVACALHTFGTQKAFFTQRPCRKTNRLQLPEGRIASSTAIYNNLTSAVPWVCDEGGGEKKIGWQPCDTLQHTSMLDAGTSVAQLWTQCDREKNVTKRHSHTQAKLSHSLCTYNNTLTGQDTRLLAEPWLAPFQSASRITLDKKKRKEKAKPNNKGHLSTFLGHNKHSKKLLKTNAKQTVSSS